MFSFQTQSKKLFGFLRFIVQRFEEGRCEQVAASLTFTTLLALVPLFTVTVTVFAAFPGFSELITQVKIFMLTNMVPEVAGKIITVYMEQFAGEAAKLTLLGIGGLIVTALLLMNTIDRTFNIIWRVRKPRSMLPRFLTYWTMLTIGPLILGASLSVTYYLVQLSLGYVQRIPQVGQFGLKLVPITLMSVAFTLLYYAVPNRYVPFRHALLGGIFAGLTFDLMKRVFALYITNFPTYTLVYGAFATFPIFLLWVYFSWLLVLLGAVIAAALSHWRAGTWQKSRLLGWHFEAALQLLQALVQAQADRQPATLAWLRKHVDLGLDEMEELLDRLMQADIVRRGQKNAWRLARAPQNIGTAEVFRLFVFDAGAPNESEAQIQTAYQSMVGKLDAEQREVLAQTLADLAPAAKTEAPKIDAPGI